ncbi:peptidoglycan DD-metalloendopeptidase family protein [Dyella sp. BiH032]|uniref:peptidoglycan DD-metalloendopeptidase family protein n=1 Tax=Dyella sp. BiH032 TaxID=3075430 RepID=UPI002892D803|nr:peptidoglycan DD-metalloendopeptidase family protein [Dyella sp. BiH032]WNL47898.1 peptidoglycan DD-metalloendopeptidase family protein [Dyella sp. BiH032]
MKGHSRYFAPAALSLLLAACVSPRSSVVIEPASGAQGRTVAPAATRAAAPGGTYRVVKGDTLYSIAFRNGVDFRDLASWNGIAAPYTIWPGQTLKLSGKEAAPVAASHAGTVATVKPAPSTAPSPTTAPGSAGGFQTVTGDQAATAPGHAATTASVPASVPASAAPASHPPVAAPAPASTAPLVVPVAGAPATAHTAAAAATPPPAPVQPVAAGATRASGGITWRWPADGTLGKRFQSGDAIPGIEILGKSGDPVRAAADGVVVYSGNGLVGYGELVIIKHNDSFLSAYGHNSKRLVKEGQRVSAGQQIAEMGSTGASRDELQFQIRRDGNPVDPLGYLPAR